MDRKTFFAALAAILALSLLGALAPGEEAWAVVGQSPGRQSIPTLTHTPGPATATVETTAEATATASGGTDEPPTPAAPGDAASTPEPVPTLITLWTPAASPESGATSPPVATVEGDPDDVSTGPRTPTPGRPAPSPTADWAVEASPFTSSTLPLGGAQCLGDLLVMGLGLLALVAGLALLRKS